MIPLARLRHSLVARNAVWLMIGQGGLKILQATYYAIIARSLGASGYGAFAAAAALSQLVGPLASLGAGNVLIQHVSRKIELFERYWSGALTLTVTTGAVSVIVAVLIGRAILPPTIATSLIVCVAVSDLVFNTVLYLCGQAYQAQEKMKRTAQLPIVTTGLRLVAAVIFVLLPGHHTAAIWGWFYVTCTALSTFTALWLATHELGKLRFEYTYGKRDIRDGFYFAAGTSAQNIYNDIDKTMLGSLVPSLTATGIYAAAYRLIDVVLVPIRSLGQAAYPRFFRRGAAGVRSSVAVSLQLLPPAVAYGAVAATIMFLSAPLLPKILGSDYEQAIAAVRWLSLLPVLKSIQFAGADALTGAGYQGTRTSLQVFVAIVNVAINFPLITHYSWRGAAWSSLFCDGLLALILWMLIWRLHSRAAVSDASKPVVAT